MALPFTCPGCGADAAAGSDRCRCGADLILLHKFNSLPDVWFNQALEALRQGQPGRALEWLSACCVAQPNDVSARVAQARVWAQLGRGAEARDCLDRAAGIDPVYPGIDELRRALAPRSSRGRKRDTPRAGDLQWKI